MMQIDPTVGRILWYRRHGKPIDGQPYAAQIALSNADGTINIGYLDGNGTHHAAQNVKLLQEGDPRPVDGGFCEWMPYQVGQAKAQTEAAKPAEHSSSMGSAAG